MSLPHYIKDAYFDIDTNDEGFINATEVRRWLRRHGIDDKKTENFLSQIDVTPSGLISLAAWCEYHDLEESSLEKAKGPLADDVTLIASDMKPGVQKAIIRAVREEMAESRTNKDAAKAIKSALDKRLERLWHVVVIKGQYWAYYSHEPASSIVFNLGGFIHVIWKTPGY